MLRSLTTASALRPLQLVVNVVVDRVIMRPSPLFPLQRGFRRNDPETQQTSLVSGALGRQNQAAGLGISPMNLAEPPS